MNSWWTSRRRMIVGILGAAFFAYALWSFRALVAYLLAAVALSFVGRPIVLFLQRMHVGKHRLPNGLIAAAVLSVFFVAAAALVVLFAPLVAAQAEAIKQLDVAQMQQFSAHLTRWLDEDLAVFDLSGTGQANSAYLLGRVQD